ncbi:hypothetical protein BSKO_06335 [Bryopsis sp. KO-2023]|nr:hypothetical protein BSKO_06335 [Bryopsis sp. KO-2023]
MAQSDQNGGSADPPSDHTTSTNRMPVRARARVSYDEGTKGEKLINLEGKEESRPNKRHRSGNVGELRKRQIPEAELESRTAWAVGLNGVALSEDEQWLLPSGTDESAYIKVRNHVLAKWRADVSQWLTEEEAAVKIMPKFRHLVTAAWRFLTQYGYINFGVAPAITDRGLKADHNKGTVIIVGAGLAGLGAARQLRGMGHTVVILEGRDRLGGRVHTKRMQKGEAVAVADLGGSVISGIDGNPLAVLAKQLSIPLHRINDDTPFYFSDGTLVNKQIDAEAEQTYNAMLDSCSYVREQLGDSANNIALGTALEALWNQEEDKRPLKRRLLDWHLANLEFANASKLDTLSMRGWDQDDPYELLGSHIFLPGCNLRLVAALADGLPVFFNSMVHTIQYTKEGVSVQTQKANFKGDAVLVTIPLGVLKRDLVKFEPPLSERKRGAIQRLGFGVLNKVVILFPEVFWGDRNDMFGHVNEAVEDRGKYFLFYSYAHISGGALLIALVAGEAAVKFEEIDKGQAVGEVMATLRRIFEPKGVTVPPPLEVVCTRWGKDPLSFGSYSSVSVGSPGAEDYDIMAESEGNRLFFAGEATTRKYPATMHGAYISGLREAANISAALERLRKEKLWKNGNSNAPPSMADKVSVDKKLTTGQLINKITSQVKPDVEFGCFSVIFGPSTGQYQNHALVQIDLGKMQPGGRAKKSHAVMNITLTRDQVSLLEKLQGGDGQRLIAVADDMGIHLNRKGPTTEALYGIVNEIAGEKEKELA